MGDHVLTQYVIYERPRDFPDGFVVREWHIVRGQAEPVPGTAVTAGSLEEARQRVPDGLVQLSPDPSDDAVIVEVWT